MFCVECGKEGPIFQKGLCPQCYIKSTTFTHGPSILSIIQCSKCGLFKYKNTWVSYTTQEIILQLIKDTYKINPELKERSYRLDCNPIETQFPCTVTISGKLQDITVEETHQLQIRITRMVCDVCSKQYGGYYEATLQIRATDRKLTTEELHSVQEMIEHMVAAEHSKGNRRLFITDTVEEHGGLDFYLSERGSAYMLARKLQNMYGGDLKQSSSTVGMREGRELTRITILLRLPAYQTGDFIKIENDYYRIQKLTAQKVYLINLKNWEETTMESKDMKKFHVYPSKDYLQEAIVVSQSPTELQIMHPQSYKNDEIIKPKKQTISSKTVTLVRLDDTLFLVPQ
jgi:nonsense-mediated mRNA decay protein 3